MRRDLRSLAWIMLGLGGLLLAAFWWSAQPAAAQCGGGASSCKTCHVVRGEAPVLDAAWHTDHAFADYCADCHGGAADQPAAEDAHAGLASPLADPAVSCQDCHDDYSDLAPVYEDLLANMGGAVLASNLVTTSADPLDAPADPLDAPADPLDAPADPLDAAPTAAAGSSSAADAAVEAEAPDETGNRVLLVLAEGLLALGVGVVVVVERRFKR